MWIWEPQKYFLILKLGISQERQIISAFGQINRNFCIHLHKTEKEGPENNLIAEYMLNRG